MSPQALAETTEAARPVVSVPMRTVAVAIVLPEVAGRVVVD